MAQLKKMVALGAVLLLAVSGGCGDDDDPSGAADARADAGIASDGGQNADATPAPSDAQVLRDAAAADVDRLTAIDRTFRSSSQHYLRSGKKQFYVGSDAEPGFYHLTYKVNDAGVPTDALVEYEELACSSCHASALASGEPIPDPYEPSCADCHADTENPTGAVADTVCIGCHSRQGAELSLSQSTNPTVAARFTDVHRTAGMGCMDCHTAEEMHGSGTAEAGMLDRRKLTCRDVGCHATLPSGGGDTPVPPEHTTHVFGTKKVDCSACHMQTVIACYNCHFDTELAQEKKRFFGPPPLNGFMFLINRKVPATGEKIVHPASMQSLVYRDKSFVALAPFYSHTITKTGALRCGGCHNNPNVRAWSNNDQNNGTMQITRWNDTTKTLTGPSGVVPVPPNWKEVFKFDFLKYDGAATDPIKAPGLDDEKSKWSLLKETADGMQLLERYGEPLTEQQMNSLKLNFGGGGN